MATMTHLPVVHYLRKTVNFNDTGIANGVKFGRLPAGAQILHAYCNVETVFNAATTNVLTVGTNSTSFDNILGTGDINEASATGQAALTGAALEFTSDTDVFVKYTQSGTAATTGKAHIVVMFATNSQQQ